MPNVLIMTGNIILYYVLQKKLINIIAMNDNSTMNNINNKTCLVMQEYKVGRWL